MTKLKLVVFLFSIIAITAVVALFTPKMHKQVIITEGKYLFVEENSTQSVPVKASVQNVTSAAVNVSNNNIQNVQNIKTTSTNINNVPVKTSNVSNIKTTQVKTTTVPQTKTVQKTVTTKPVSTQVKTVQTSAPVKTASAAKTVSAPKTTTSNTEAMEKWRNEQAQKKQQVEKEAAAKAAKEKVENNYPTAQRVLTEHEETIVWNKWRSDLQNKVMKDTNIGAPKGTGFRFSFTVDKYGNMSNINVWSTNPVYTDLAVRVIKPVLQSYQHQPILKFPAGTKRTITNVTGGFVMSTYTQYSKPSDYSDVEKVKLKY